MFYGLHVKPLDNGKFEASSPDLPECVFDADSIDEATELATEMMPGAMELFYRQKRRAIPSDSHRRRRLPDSRPYPRSSKNPALELHGQQPLSRRRHGSNAQGIPDASTAPRRPHQGRCKHGSA